MSSVGEDACLKFVFADVYVFTEISYSKILFGLCSSLERDSKYIILFIDYKEAVVLRKSSYTYSLSSRC